MVSQCGRCVDSVVKREEGTVAECVHLEVVGLECRLDTFVWKGWGCVFGRCRVVRLELFPLQWSCVDVASTVVRVCVCVGPEVCYFG